MRHPRTADLDLKNEVIIHIAANLIRVSVATLSGKVRKYHIFRSLLALQFMR